MLVNQEKFSVLVGPDHLFHVVVAAGGDGVCLLYTSDPVAKKFTEAFRAKYDKEPNSQSTMSYDSVQIIVDALQRAGTVEDSEAFRDALAETDLDLPSGHLVYDENRNPEKAANVMIYKDGKPAYVTTIAPNK